MTDNKENILIAVALGAILVIASLVIDFNTHPLIGWFVLLQVGAIAIYSIIAYKYHTGSLNRHEYVWAAWAIAAIIIAFFTFKAHA